MITDQNFNDIETTDIKASFKVSQILRALLDAVNAGDDEDDALSFYDKELLEDVLRFGTIAEVARRKEESYNKLRVQMIRILYHISDSVEQIHSQKREILSLKNSLAAQESKYEEKNLELLETKTQLYQTQNMLNETLDKLSKAEEKLAQTKSEVDTLKQELTESKSVAKANTMAALAQLKKEKAKSEAAAKKEAHLMQNKLNRLTVKLSAKDQTNTELQARLDIADKKLNKAMEVIKSLRMQIGQNYKALYEAALETIERQRKENTALEDFLNHLTIEEPLNKKERRTYFKNRKLRSKIAALERKIKNYKSQGISALLDFEPEML